MPVTHFTFAIGTPIAGLFLSPFGIALFGVFGLFGLFIPIILVLALANAVGGRSRAGGDPSGVGLAIGFLVLTIAMITIGALVS